MSIDVWQRPAYRATDKPDYGKGIVLRQELRSPLRLALLTVVVTTISWGAPDRAVELKVVEHGSVVVFEFMLVTYRNTAPREEIRSDLEGVTVRDEQGKLLGIQSVDEFSIYSTPGGTPVVRFCLPIGSGRRTKELTLSAMVCLNNEYYLLYGAASHVRGRWQKRELVDYGVLVWCFPRLVVRAKEVSDTKKELNPTRMDLAFRLWPTERISAHPAMKDSQWFLTILGKGSQVLLMTELPLKHVVRTSLLPFHIPKGALEGQKDIWLTLHGFIEGKNLVFTWRLSLNDRGKWFLAEEPDYGEVFRIAIGLTKSAKGSGTPAEVQK